MISIHKIFTIMSSGLIMRLITATVICDAKIYYASQQRNQQNGMQPYLFDSPVNAHIKAHLSLFKDACKKIQSL
ncbi:hypothetical protein CLU79DRAFT_735159 [Phycomyces nitens]|nr:hypothetical protein CLU79DRAFT_735159 [Phycomyces nitens]